MRSAPRSGARASASPRWWRPPASSRSDRQAENPHPDAFDYRRRAMRTHAALAARRVAWKSDSRLKAQPWEGLMRAIRHGRQWRCVGIAAVVVATAWTTGAVWSQKAEKPGGPHIQFGEGHFNRDGAAFHDWDKVKEIPAVCARCHGANGVPEYLKEGKNAPAPHVRNAFACTNCHADLLTYERHAVAKVNFPSGISVDSGNNDGNLCMTCHQGRESTASLNKAIAGLPADTPDPKLGFVHVHYLPAGATIFGTDAMVGYEYEGKTYAGRFTHAAGVDTCTACHEAHGGTVAVAKCGGCHQGVKALADLGKIRMSSRGDFDGNGRQDGMAREIPNLHKE